MPRTPVPGESAGLGCADRRDTVLILEARMAELRLRTAGMVSLVFPAAMVCFALATSLPVFSVFGVLLLLFVVPASVLTLVEARAAGPGLVERYRRMRELLLLVGWFEMGLFLLLCMLFLMSPEIYLPG